jgi:hypothetical protein
MRASAAWAALFMGNSETETPISSAAFFLIVSISISIG